MDKQKLIYIFAAILVIFFAFNLIARFTEDEEAKVKRFMNKARSAFEKEDLIYLATIISRDYTDEYNNSRERILFVARSIFRDYEKLSIGIKAINVELNDSGAIVEIEALILAKPDQKIMPEQNTPEYDIIKLKVHLIKKDSGWEIIRVDFIERPQYMFFHAA